MKKSVILLIAAVLLAAVCFAGAASADETAGTWADLKSKVEAHTTTDPLTIIVTGNFTSTEATTFTGISVTGTVIIKPSSDKDIVIDGEKNHGRFFNVGSGGNLTIEGNGVRTLTLTKGKIDGANGGAVIVVGDSSKLTLNEGAQITDCEANAGGGVATSGAFIMNGGLISDCKATVASSGGGGVYIYAENGGEGGSFTMNGGSVTQCSATKSNSDGGGVYGTKKTSITMNSGYIFLCTANRNGGGVALVSDPTNSSSLYIGGDGEIVSNTVNGNLNNLWLSDDTVLHLSRDFIGKLYIKSPSTNSFGVADAATNKGAQNIIQDDNVDPPTVGTIDANNKLVWSANGHFVTFRLSLGSTETIWTQSAAGGGPVTDPSAHLSKKGYVLDGWYSDAAYQNKWNFDDATTAATTLYARWKAPVAEIVENGTTYLSVNDAIKAVDATNKTVRLLADSTLTGEIEIKNDVILNLSGRNLTAAHEKRMFHIPSGGNLTLMNTDSEGKLMGSGMVDDAGGCVYIDGGKLTLSDGVTITGFNSGSSGGGIHQLGGEFNMTGGTIATCNATKGGAVYVVSSGIFNMTGGTIDRCNATDGGGIYHRVGTTTIGNQARITNCTATNGGGIFSYNSYITLRGGKIINCSATNGGGIYVDYRQFTMRGGDITGCTASDNGGGVYINSKQQQNPTVLLMYGGNISGCKVTNGNGAGVYVGVDKSPQQWGSFQIRNLVNITGNTKKGSANNVYLAKPEGTYNAYINITSALTTGARINVTTADIPTETALVNITPVCEADYSAFFGSDNSSHYVQYNTTTQTHQLALKIFNITYIQPTDGIIDIFVSPMTAPEGKKVTVTVTPNSGYTFKGLAVTQNGTATKVASTEKTFIMPAYDVNVTATFKKTMAPSSSGGNGGATVIMTDTPTVSPTVNPTASVPTIAPSGKPTAQQTQQSPAPFAGLVLGLGAAVLFLRLRK